MHLYGSNIPYSESQSQSANPLDYHKGTIHHRATYFQGYKISRIIGNLLQREFFVDKFSRMKVISNNSY